MTEYLHYTSICGISVSKPLCQKTTCFQSVRLPRNHSVFCLHFHYYTWDTFMHVSPKDIDPVCFTLHVRNSSPQWNSWECLLVQFISISLVLTFPHHMLLDQTRKWPQHFLCLYHWWHQQGCHWEQPCLRGGVVYFLIVIYHYLYVGFQTSCQMWAYMVTHASRGFFKVWLLYDELSFVDLSSVDVGLEGERPLGEGLCISQCSRG